MGFVEGPSRARRPPGRPPGCPPGRWRNAAWVVEWAGAGESRGRGGPGQGRAREEIRARILEWRCDFTWPFY